MTTFSAQPDWATAPSWANFAAMDANGVWHWYDEQPFNDSVHAKQYNEWTFKGDGRYKAIDKFHNWKNSLQARPK